MSLAVDDEFRFYGGHGNFNDFRERGFDRLHGQARDCGQSQDRANHRLTKADVTYCHNAAAPPVECEWAPVH
jgi:hypothetical protein